MYKVRYVPKYCMEKSRRDSWLVVVIQICMTIRRSMCRIEWDKWQLQICRRLVVNHDHAWFRKGDEAIRLTRWYWLKAETVILLSYAFCCIRTRWLQVRRSLCHVIRCMRASTVYIAYDSTPMAHAFVSYLCILLPHRRRHGASGHICVYRFAHMCGFGRSLQYLGCRRLVSVCAARC